MSALPKPKPYRRYLNSVLHSRFVYATLLALLNGLVISFWAGKDYFWSWFPFGPAGIKAASFTLCNLFVFVLQIASLTVGRQTVPSPFLVLRRRILHFSSLWTIFWYTISAWWFCQVLIFAVPGHKQLGWVIKGDMASPDRLNERPMYLRWFFTVLALVQAAVHLYCGRSLMHIPVTRPATPQANDQRTHLIESVMTQASRRAPYMIKNAVISSLVASPIALFTYKYFVRNIFWKIHLNIAKLFSNISRSDAQPPDTYFVGTILGFAFLFGILLSLTWESSTYSLLAYMEKEPVKNGYPLSAGSQDPNGTLLNGLSSKIDLVKTFAFWELTIIAQRYPDRRRAIFADFERPNGSMWSSMHKAALGVVAGIDDRILALTPTPPQATQQTQVASLPKLIPTSNSGSISAARPPPSSWTQWGIDLLATAGAKRLGESSNPWRPPIEKRTQEVVNYTQAVALQNKGYLMQLLDYVSNGLVRDVFYTRNSSKISSVVLGTPVENAAIIVDAIESLTKMLIASLNEDDYGKVVQTVPDTVKQFTRTIQLINGYIRTTAQDLAPGDELELEEVVIVIQRLKAGSRELLGAFQVFLNDAGLSIKDLNEAMKASEDGPVLPERQPQNEQPEMQQVTEEPQRKQLGSRDGQRAPEERRAERRAEERQPRRSSSGSRKQQNGDGNVFGARDFNSEPGRRRGQSTR